MKPIAIIHRTFISTGKPLEPVIIYPKEIGIAHWYPTFLLTVKEPIVRLNFIEWLSQE